MPLPGLNFGRALASAAGAAQNQRGALATLIGVWGGGRDYRTSGGGTDYRVAAAQKAEAERQQYEQEKADQIARDKAQFERQKELTQMREGSVDGWTPQNKEEALEVLKAKRAPSGWKPQTMDEYLSAHGWKPPTQEKFVEVAGQKAGKVAEAELPTDIRKIEKSAEESRKTAAAKPPTVALQKYEAENRARAADDAMGELPVFSSMPFSQRPAFSERGLKERKIVRDREEKLAKETRDREQRATEREAPSGRELEMERIRQGNRQEGRVEADKIRDENARVTREQKVQDMGAKSATDKAKAEARSREIATEERRKIEENALKAGQARAKTEMSMAMAMASMRPDAPKSQATIAKFNDLAQKYTDAARATAIDNLAVSKVKGFTLEEVREQTADLTRAFTGGQTSMTREQYIRLMSALAEREKELK